MTSLFSHHTSNLEFPLGLRVDVGFRDPVVSVGDLRGRLDLREELVNVFIAVHVREDLWVVGHSLAHDKVRQRLVVG